MVTLATALCKNLTLRTLNLDDNQIGQEGAAAVAQMLAENMTLRKLYLRDDSMGKEGVCQLVRSLDHNCTLEKIWLPIKFEYTSSYNPRIAWY